MIKQLIWIASFTFLMGVFEPGLGAQSIEEKKANLKGSESDLDKETDEFLLKINQETGILHTQIQNLYTEVERLYDSGAPEESYKNLLDQINKRKNYLNSLENQWRALSSKNNRKDGYGLWHAPETSLEQLVIDYGSQDYVYLIPTEVATIKLSIDSNLPIPRASWTEMLELILTQNGVGIKQLNPYLRQLYLIKDNHSSLKLITNKREDLEILPSTSRVSFVLAPEPSEVRRTYTFLEKFVNPNSTTLQVLGRDILVTGQAGDIIDLLKLYDFVATNRGEKDYRLIPVYKTPAAEMAKILEAMFDQANQGVVIENAKGKAPSKNTEINGLKIVILENMAQAIFVVGTKDEVRKASEIVNSVESQIGGARDKLVFWYTVLHSDAEQLADVLYKVYSLMMTTGTGMEGENGESIQTQVNVEQPGPDLLPVPQQKQPPNSLYGEEGFYQEGGYVINPKPIEPKAFKKNNPNDGRDNFIVDAKSGSIVMVVEADILPKIKDLLRKLDVPKKMVQIETLLFEKILSRENNFGLNLLKIGDHIASNTNVTGAVFNNIIGPGDKAKAGNTGVFEFLLSRQKSDSGIPAFDLAYRFLLAQDDVQINSNPTILTVNQVPATIAINEEVSISTGIFEVETAKGNSLKDAFTRAQYGISINILPTIHAGGSESEDGLDYVTLETDITFDTFSPRGDPHRPDVTRRHIKNEVQVPDGDTVVIGGLRRKVTHDKREGVPFLGELPGLGKFFSLNHTKDDSTEMFIFITPHIVKDPKEQLQCLRQKLLCLRPGDVPYFLECVEEAHRFQKTILMEGSMTMLFGRPRERYYLQNCCEAGEYDGR